MKKKEWKKKIKDSVNWFYRIKSKVKSWLQMWNISNLISNNSNDSKQIFLEFFFSFSSLPITKRFIRCFEMKMWRLMDWFLLFLKRFSNFFPIKRIFLTNVCEDVFCTEMFHFRKFKIINLYRWLTIILILIDFFPSTLWYLIILVDGRRLLSQSSSSNSMLSKIIISNRSKRSRSFNDFDDSEYFSKQKWIHFLQDPKDLQPSHTERSNDYYSERSDCLCWFYFSFFYLFSFWLRRYH